MKLGESTNDSVSSNREQLKRITKMIDTEDESMGFLQRGTVYDQHMRRTVLFTDDERELRGTRSFRSRRDTHHFVSFTTRVDEVVCYDTSGNPMSDYPQHRLRVDMRDAEGRYEVPRNQMPSDPIYGGCDVPRHWMPTDPVYGHFDVPRHQMPTDPVYGHYDVPRHQMPTDPVYGGCDVPRHRMPTDPVYGHFDVPRHQMPTDPVYGHYDVPRHQMPTDPVYGGCDVPRHRMPTDPVYGGCDVPRHRMLSEPVHRNYDVPRHRMPTDPLYCDEPIYYPQLRHDEDDYAPSNLHNMQRQARRCRRSTRHPTAESSADEDGYQDEDGYDYLPSESGTNIYDDTLHVRRGRPHMYDNAPSNRQNR